MIWTAEQCGAFLDAIEGERPVPIKVISETPWHATNAFTPDVYTSVASEPAEQAAQAIAAFVPRRNHARAHVPAGGQHDLETTKGVRTVGANSLVTAEARGFEPRRGPRPQPH